MRGQKTQGVRAPLRASARAAAPSPPERHGEDSAHRMDATSKFDSRMWQEQPNDARVQAILEEARRLILCSSDVTAAILNGIRRSQDCGPKGGRMRHPCLSCLCCLQSRRCATHGMPKRACPPPCFRARCSSLRFFSASLRAELLANSETPGWLGKRHGMRCGKLHF